MPNQAEQQPPKPSQPEQPPKTSQPEHPIKSTTTPESSLKRLADVIESRKTADPDKSYVARLLIRGEDAILKKIGEEATETVMAAKDGRPDRIIAETADLWFHSMVMLAHYGLRPEDVIAELERREGLSGLDEKALRKNREYGAVMDQPQSNQPQSDQPSTGQGPESEAMHRHQHQHQEKECLFCRIARGEIPCNKVYEDEDILAFHDINPAAPVHFLIIPKTHLVNLYDADLSQAALLGRMFGIVGQLAREQGCLDGFRAVVNTGRVGRQEVYHLHIHVMGGPEALRSGR